MNQRQRPPNIYHAPTPAHGLDLDPIGLPPVYMTLRNALRRSGVLHESQMCPRAAQATFLISLPYLASQAAQMRPCCFCRPTVDFDDLVGAPKPVRIKIRAGLNENRD